MANSSLIMTVKKDIINAICNDSDIVSIIDSPKYKGEDLKNTHIFTYNKNPNVITESITFLTVLVDARLRDRNGTFVTPTVTIYIYTHYQHIDINNIISKKPMYYNRNDYLAFLLDEKFNGSSEYGGIGELQLVSNYEFVATEKFLGRKLVFETIDVNDSPCDNRW